MSIPPRPGDDSPAPAELAQHIIAKCSAETADCYYKLTLCRETSLLHVEECMLLSKPVSPHWPAIAQIVAPEQAVPQLIGAAAMVFPERGAGRPAGRTPRARPARHPRPTAVPPRGPVPPRPDGQRGPDHRGRAAPRRPAGPAPPPG